MNREHHLRRIVSCLPLFNKIRTGHVRPSVAGCISLSPWSSHKSQLSQMMSLLPFTVLLSYLTAFTFIILLPIVPIFAGISIANSHKIYIYIFIILIYTRVAEFYFSLSLSLSLFHLQLPRLKVVISHLMENYFTITIIYLYLYTRCIISNFNCKSEHLFKLL